MSGSSDQLEQPRLTCDSPDTYTADTPGYEIEYPPGDQYDLLLFEPFL